MKIYAIRDRLIDYYMQPFLGPDDKNVLASVARLINQGEITSDIAQAPHHFEVWGLGEVQEDGTITAHRELLADCSSLIRTGLRESPADGRGNTTTPQRQRTHSDAPSRNGAHPGTHHSPVPITPPEPAGAAEELPEAHRGGYPPPHLQEGQ